VTVRPDGGIEVRSSGLRPGSRAEVIVVESPEPSSQESDFFFANLSLDELATRQGITGSVPFDQLLGGWPGEKRDDGFERAVARWCR
jgi:hypothetical protein